MQHKTSVLQWTRPRSIAALGLSILLLLSTASLSQAQSGRRPPKQPTAPDPLPPKQEGPLAKPSSDQDSKSQIPVKVVWGVQNINASTIYSRIVEDGCMERLSKSSVRATPAADMNRKQAHDIAKGSTDTYVLWFEMEVDVANTDRAALGGVPAEYLYVRYEVFAPGTGKTKTAGRVYQRRVGPGGVPLPTSLPRTTGSAEYSLRYAGREMADRLLDTLNLPRPSERH